jgi:nicotinamide mononucleotide adenylyltransferase
MKKYALFIGRWQTWHKGHEWLINQQLEKGKNCWVAIRDVQVDENNQKTAQEVLKELQNEPFFTQNWDKILLSIIPDIESVNYGRAVGYEVIYHEPPKEIEEISGTAIRKKYIDSNGDVIIYNIDKNDSTTEETHS